MIATATSEDGFAAWRAKADARLQILPISGMTPEMSDHLSGLYHEATVELIEKIALQVKKIRTSMPDQGR